MEYALQAIELRKQFADFVAVDNVTLNIPEGAVFGLLGRNGAGKTTTIRMLMNIYMPDAGKVLLRGEKVSGEFRERVGYLPEERGLYKKMKLLDTILFFAELKGCRGEVIRQRALDYLQKFDLLDRKDDKLEELSKGNQQKVQFICTIIHEPDFIILDEPFSGLDPVNTNLLKNIILELKAKGKVIIFSTHLMDFAEKMCDHIAIIHQGKLLLSGELQSIKTEYSQRNVSLVYEGDISPIKQLPYVESVENFGRYTGIRVRNQDDVQNLLKALIDNNIKVKKFDANDISLHEIFVSLTSGKEDGIRLDEEKGELVNV
jgi:ABC-2 type transport system ATP-binding protein